MTSESFIAEYYFEYKMVKVGGKDGVDVREPKLYFERNYRNPRLPYTTYAVPFEWIGQQRVFDSVNEKSAEERQRNLAKLPYDRVKVTFDIKGIECAPLADEKSEIFKNAEFKEEQDFEQFYKGECRTPIDNSGAEDHSGVGYIEMFSGEQSVARFFFAINYVMRKQISYELKKKDKKLNIKFICPDRPQGVSVKVTYALGVLPCLKNETPVSDGVIDLDFSKRSTYECEVDVENERFNDAVFSVTFADKNIEKYYILDCISNETLKLKKVKQNVLQPDITCPYCQQKMNASIMKSSAYKNGAVACNYGESGTKGDNIEIIANTEGSKKQAKAKRCIYCKNDVEDAMGGKSFSVDYMRLLPRDFMRHDCFKIAFTGSMRAGKTTYISRFFDIGIDHGAKTDMTMMCNSLQKFSVNIEPSLISEVESLGGKAYRIGKRNWISEQQQYQSRAISITPPKFPGATNSASNSGVSYERYPFIAEINKRHYVSFYDVAGEDAQSSTLITNIANGSIIGVFLIVNGNMNPDQTKSVITMLRNAKLDERCPVAIMLAKMDVLEKEFDSNAQCIRTDYFEYATGSYENSHLSNVIDIASEEIRAYLISKGINFANIEQYFNNVRYFGVTSFNFNDSIHSEGDSIDKPGNVNFMCSSKRLELPFIWMLKQFGVIR